MPSPTQIVGPERTFATDGVELRRAVLSQAQIDEIKAQVCVGHEIFRRTGIRNLEKKFDSIARVAASRSVLSTAASLLGSTPRLVRALFFDKTRERNWSVAWHQDRTVTLNRRVQMPGWGKWSRKEGVHHAEPARAVLDHMVTIRLHVDAVDLEAGCLNVIPGSHRGGILSQDAIHRMARTATPLACVVAAGDAVVMHPLVLHCSMKSRRSSPRRVVHLEYSSYELPRGVRWA
jgi:hypothetical protein